MRHGSLDPSEASGEDFDSSTQPDSCPDAFGPDQQLANRVRTAFYRLLEQRGADRALGARLPRMLREAAGLVDVGADAYSPVATPGALGLERSNIVQVRDGLVAGGFFTTEEVDVHLANVDAGTVDIAMPPLVSAWGRRP